MDKPKISVVMHGQEGNEFMVFYITVEGELFHRQSREGAEEQYNAAMRMWRLRNERESINTVGI